MDARAKVERRVVFTAGTWEVWAALTRPEKLSEWFGEEVVTLDLRPGGRLVFRDAAGHLRRAIIEVVDAPERFAFRWLPAPVAPGGQAPERIPGSRVEFLVRPEEGGTSLTVVETPAVALPAPGEMLPVPGPIVLAPPPAMVDPYGLPRRHWEPPTITMLG
ncbi:MAG TPA: SRPBCC domain-containing protein [Actinomycetota bacterium]|nr:SRPBCC domain-containing protein [Actinomycetota bacterium]